MKDIEQKALELCWKIETLPASKLQTDISCIAAALHGAIQKHNNTMHSDGEGWCECGKPLSKTCPKCQRLWDSLNRRR